MVIQTIENYWDKGFLLHPTDLSFLDSGFGISTEKEFRNIFSSSDFSEQELILEYLLFPDQELRLSIEPLLDPAGLPREYQDAIVYQLADRYTGVKLIHPDGAGPVDVKVTFAQISQFVARLYLTRNIDCDICDALTRHGTWLEVLACRVLLRTRKFSFEKVKKQFLLKFLDQSWSRPAEFFKVFSLFLELLSRVPDGRDPAAGFIDIRHKEKIMLDHIREFEEKRARYNMEYLMLSKYPVPHESLETVFDRLELIDIIIEHIPGILPLTPPDPPVHDLGQFDKKNMDALFRVLSS